MERWRRALPAVVLFASGIAIWEALVRILDIKAFIVPEPQGT